ncbi:unnamed protein product [Effrenium voratum]|nr:unnamed protein product [Effrenium voratum]
MGQQDEPSSKPRRAEALLPLCSCAEAPAVLLERLRAEVAGQLRAKEADATLAAAQMADFELRLQVAQLARGLPGLEREALLCAAHGAAAQLRGLVQEQAAEPLEAQLRRLAQQVVAGADADPEELEGLRPPKHTAACQACQQLAGDSSAGAPSGRRARLALQRAEKALAAAQRQSARLQALLQVAGLEPIAGDAPEVAFPAEEVRRESRHPAKVEAVLAEVRKLGPRSQCLVLGSAPLLKKLQELLESSEAPLEVCWLPEGTGEGKGERRVLLASAEFCEKRRRVPWDGEAVRHVFLTQPLKGPLERRVAVEAAVVHRFWVAQTVEEELHAS